ncbi:MAG: hypothetical protein V1850_07395 [Candidatus Bathyarchaeota archaeon]
MSTTSMQDFKEQLLEFVEEREEPFNATFLVENCNSFVDDEWVRGALCELEDEGRIVKVDHHYLSTRILMRRWIRTKEEPELISKDFLNGPFVPLGLIDQVEELLDERQELGYLDVDEFVRDAVRRLLEKFGKTLKERSGKGR